MNVSFAHFRCLCMLFGCLCMMSYMSFKQFFFVSIISNVVVVCLEWNRTVFGCNINFKELNKGVVLLVTV